MTSTLTNNEPATPVQPQAPAGAGHAFRLRAIMRQGTAASLPAVWERYPTTEAAKAAIRAMYHDDRVLRAFIVTDEAPPKFVEWVER